MADGHAYIPSHEKLVSSMSHSSTNITIDLNNSFSSTDTSSTEFRSNHTSLQRHGATITSLDITLMKAIHVLDEYAVPTILTIGLVTNIILSIIIRKSELKKVSTYCYFFTMGIVDSVYLVAMFVPWISVRYVDIYNKEGFCQLVYYLNLLTTFLSSWYVVMLLIERVITSYKPETVRHYCSAFRTKCYITTVTVFAVVAHLYLTWTSGVFSLRTVKRCTVIPENIKDIVILRKVDIVFSFILPMLATVGFLVSLAVYICAYYVPCKDGRFTFSTNRLTFELRIHSPSVRKHSTEYSVVGKSSRNLTSNSSQKMRIKSMQGSLRVTVVSIIIAFMYALLFIPHNVIKSRITFMDNAYKVTHRDGLYLTLFEEIYKFNFAYKGIIYFSCLPEMREKLVKCFISCKRKIVKKSKEHILVTRV